MLVGVGIVFGKLIALPARAHHMTPVQTRHPRAAVTAFLDIVFTFGGQVSVSHLLQLRPDAVTMFFVVRQCWMWLAPSAMCTSETSGGPLAVCRGCSLRAGLQCNLLWCVGSCQDCCLCMQVNWVRYVSGMKRRSDFKYSAAFAGVFMTVNIDFKCTEALHHTQSGCMIHAMR